MLIQHFVNIFAQGELLRFPHPAVASAELLALELVLHRHHIDLVLEMGQLLGGGDLLGLSEANQVLDAYELLLIDLDSTLVELRMPAAFVFGCCFLCCPPVLLVLQNVIELCGLQRHP